MSPTDNPCDVRANDGQSETDNEHDPLDCYTLSHLVHLQAFVAEELARLSGAPFSSLDTGREENANGSEGESRDSGSTTSNPR